MPKSPAPALVRMLKVQVNDRQRSRRVLALLAALLLLVFAGGMIGASPARALFILGCPVVAWLAWRVGPELHVQVAIALFALAPLLRRVVDVNTGYDDNGVMLVGPLLALLAPLPILGDLLTRREQNMSRYTPYVLILLCILYGWALSAFRGDYLPATIVALKWSAPLLYAMCLLQRAEVSDRVTRAAASAFMIVTPVIGLYGIYQFLNPLEWDRYWMIYSKMWVIGLPEPMKVRIFGTMNAPAGYASFLACGLLLFGFCQRGALAGLLAFPVCIALLLTMYRTAWLGLGAGIAFCFFYRATRDRAVLIASCLAVGSVAAVLLTPFGDQIGDRLATLTRSVAQDGSGSARIAQYMGILADSDSYLIGAGFAGSVSKYMALGAIDGQLIESTLFLGIAVGLLHLCGILWASAQALSRIRPDDGPLRLVTAAVIVGGLVQMPLSSLMSGELGFLFWTFVALLAAAPRRIGAAPGERGTIAGVRGAAFAPAHAHGRHAPSP